MTKMLGFLKMKIDGNIINVQGLGRCIIDKAGRYTIYLIRDSDGVKLYTTDIARGETILKTVRVRRIDRSPL